MWRKYTLLFLALIALTTPFVWGRKAIRKAPTWFTLEPTPVRPAKHLRLSFDLRSGKAGTIELVRRKHNPSFPGCRSQRQYLYADKVRLFLLSRPQDRSEGVDAFCLVGPV